MGGGFRAFVRITFKSNQRRSEFCGCQVNIRVPSDGDKSSLIRIEGDPDGVQKAKKELAVMGERMVRE